MSKNAMIYTVVIMIDVRSNLHCVDILWHMCTEVSNDHRSITQGSEAFYRLLAIVPAEVHRWHTEKWVNHRFYTIFVAIGQGPDGSQRGPSGSLKVPQPNVPNKGTFPDSPQGSLEGPQGVREGSGGAKQAKNGCFWLFWDPAQVPQRVPRGPPGVSEGTLANYA